MEFIPRMYANVGWKCTNLIICKYEFFFFLISLLLRFSDFWLTSDITFIWNGPMSNKTFLYVTHIIPLLLWCNGTAHHSYLSDRRLITYNIMTLKHLEWLHETALAWEAHKSELPFILNIYRKLTNGLTNISGTELYSNLSAILVSLSIQTQAHFLYCDVTNRSNTQR